MADYSGQTIANLVVPHGNEGPYNYVTPTYTYYHQRVYSSLLGWCYYTKTVIDASPLSAETTPNWTGSISLHSVIAVT
jgi:hypothetical protein